MTLNVRQRRVAIGGVAIALLPVLFPPWYAKWAVQLDTETVSQSIREPQEKYKRYTTVVHDEGIVRGYFLTGPHVRLPKPSNLDYSGTTVWKVYRVKCTATKIMPGSIEAWIRFDRLALEVLAVLCLTAFIVFLLRSRIVKVATSDQRTGGDES